MAVTCDSSVRDLLDSLVDSTKPPFGFIRARGH